MNYKEKYAPKPAMGVDATLMVPGVQLGGFITKTAGTITVVNGGVTYVDAVPIAAGQYMPLPLGFNEPGITVTLAGGASGTLLV